MLCHILVMVLPGNPNNLQDVHTMQGIASEMTYFSMFKVFTFKRSQ